MALVPLHLQYIRSRASTPPLEPVYLFLLTPHVLLIELINKSFMVLLSSFSHLDLCGVKERKLYLQTDKLNPIAHLGKADGKDTGFPFT